MSSAHIGKEPKKEPTTASAQAKSQSGDGCSFCWFVLAVYPTLRGMTDRDTTTFREHLKKVHGLREEIRE